MDVRQLEFFIAVSQEGSFTKAAQRSFVSQPGLSASIQSLERELRVRLFDRGRHGARLTPEGSLLFPVAQRIVDGSKAIRDELSRSGASSSDAEGARIVRIGTEQCLGTLVDLPDLLTTFGRQNLGAEIRHVQAHSHELTHMLGQGRLDVAFVATGVDGSSRVAASPAGLEPDAVLVRTEPFVLLVPAQHRLAGSGDEVAWAELAKEQLVDLAPDWTARRILDNTLAPDQRPPAAAEVDDVHMLLDLVNRGLGLTVVPESIARKPEGRSLRARVVVRPEVSWQVSVLTSGNAQGPARAFASMLLPQDTVNDLRSKVHDPVAASIGSAQA